MKIKAIYIDIDNTLLDFDDHTKRSLKEGFETYGLPPYKEEDFSLFKTINDSLWLRLEKGEIDLSYIIKNRFDLIFEAMGIKMDGNEFERFYRASIRNHAQLMPEAKQMLESLKGKALLYAASNAPIGQQSERLALAGIRDYFDDVFVSEEFGFSKPDKRFFESSLAKIKKDRGLSLLPQECLIIGDSLTSDIAGGKNFGMHTILYERYSMPNLKGNEAEFISPSLKSIGNFLLEKDFDL